MSLGTIAIYTSHIENWKYSGIHLVLLQMHSFWPLKVANFQLQTLHGHCGQRGTLIVSMCASNPALATIYKHSSSDIKIFLQVELVSDEVNTELAATI